MTPSSSIRRRAALCCVGALALFPSACSDTDSSAEAAAVDDGAGDEASWLYSQTADSGRLEMTDGQVTRLVMNDIDPHTIAFSDRPERLTEIVDTGTLTDAWNEMFGDDPPNAVLVEHQPEGETDSLVVVLREPVFDATARTLTYDVEVFADEQHPESLTGIVGDVHAVPPTEFRAVSLFIDCTIIPPPPDTTPPTLPPPTDPPSPGPPRPPGY